MPEAHPGVDAQTHGEAVSFEFIADVAPDWLIVIDRGAATGSAGQSATATLDNVLITQTRAWTSGQVVFLDPGRIYIAGGGLQSISGTLDEMTNAFAPQD